MRIAEPRDGSTPSEKSLAPTLSVPNVEAIYRLTKDDSGAGTFCSLYFLKNIEPSLQDDEFYRKDVQDHSSVLSSISWVILSFIDSVAKKGDTHVPTTAPPSGSIVVANGSSPKPESVQDYHNWYNQEHGEKLACVPGWQMGRRHKLEKSFGEVETASFYGVNFYDQVNGLGGPEWKAGVTEWTMRIRDQAAKPNVRRVWKLVKTERL